MITAFPTSSRQRLGFDTIELGISFIAYLLKNVFRDSRSMFAIQLGSLPHLARYSAQDFSVTFACQRLRDEKY